MSPDVSYDGLISLMKVSVAVSQSCKCSIGIYNVLAAAQGLPSLSRRLSTERMR